MPFLYMKNCKNCNSKIRFGNWCPKKECQAARCHEYYLKTKERRIEVGMETYKKNLANPKRYKRMLLTNKKAHNNRRFGMQDVSEIKKKYNNRCAICKKDKPLVIHHIDKQGRNVKNPNNEISNLIPLCNGCHARIHLLGQELI